MKKILVCFLLLLFPLLNAQVLYTNDPVLKQAAKKISDFPLSKRCMDQFREPIRVVWCDNTDFEGFWNWKTKTIYISAKLNRSEGRIITTMLFELHNAIASKKLAYVEKLGENGILSKTEYVRAVERIEHDNALATARILREGIEASYFPRDAEWPVIEDFSDHYLLQRMTGHSDWIADKYDQFNNRRKEPYYDALSYLNQKEKTELLKLFFMKQQLNQKDKQVRAKEVIQEELRRELACRKLPKGHPLCSKREKLDAFLHELFPLLDVKSKEIPACGVSSTL